jgi:hypothetical protein
MVSGAGFAQLVEEAEQGKLKETITRLVDLDLIYATVDGMSQLGSAPTDIPF